MDRCDVLVIGGGHAGAEAATLAARMGARTLLVTQSIETIGQMSCNPAIGGIAKGTVVREVDALGGVMGRATDQARIQFRMLNRSKGPAVWSPRAQCDRGLYRRAVRSLLELNPRLLITQGMVAKLLIRRGAARGVQLVDGRQIEAGAVVLTAGTFLRGAIHVGKAAAIPAGRAGDPPSVELAQNLAEHGLSIERFKTGTPPRIDGRTVDFTKLVRQDGDAEPYWFSFHGQAWHPPQRPCWLTHAGAGVKEIILAHLADSALYGGEISGRGPRYCPSIEDKVVRFPDAIRHQVFLEPEGLDTTELYVNGLSTSLPVTIQQQYLQAVPGLEAVRITRAGYAIEYDYFPPTQLTPSLESRAIRGLFMAGQVNGTTGYEEAAGQGVLAGLNAAAFVLERDPVTLRRDEAFLGVLADDLVSRGVDEPYRLFTSRAEFRLLLRQDNALRRLLPMAERLGLLTDDERRQAHARLEREEVAQALVEATAITPEIANPLLERSGSAPIAEPVRLSELAKRPEVALFGLAEALDLDLAQADLVWASIEFRYAGYLERERKAADRLGRQGQLQLPVDMDYQGITTLSIEAREKLARHRPATLGQAARIPGVSPSDLHNLLTAIALRPRGASSFT